MALADLLNASHDSSPHAVPAGSAPSLSLGAGAPSPLGASARDPRAQRILAKTIYRELLQSGMSEADVMSIAGELLNLVADGMRDRREGPASR